MSEENKEGRLFVTNVVVSLFTPTRLAGEGKIKALLGIDKIPATMKPLLRQEVIGRKVINPLAAIKKRVRDLLLQYGTREPLLGWVVDPDRIDALMTQIKAQEEQYESAKEYLLEHYAAECDKHLLKLEAACHKDGLSPKKTALLCDVVRQEQPSRKYLELQLEFRYLEPRDIRLAPHEYEMVADNLFEQTLSDIAVRCKEAQRTTTNIPKAKALEEIIRKIAGLTYLDPRFRNLETRLRALREQLPASNLPNKKWNDRDVFAIEGAINLVADRRKLLDYLESSEMHQEGLLFDGFKPDLLDAAPKVVETPQLELVSTTDEPATDPTEDDPVETVTTPTPPPEPAGIVTFGW